MKENTVKQPVPPRVDHSQGQNLLVRLLAKIFAGGSSLIEEWKAGKHGDSKCCRNSTNFIRKIRAKKKRKRKIAYASKIAAKFPNRRRVRV